MAEREGLEISMLLISLETAAPFSPFKSPSLAVDLAVAPTAADHRAAARASRSQRKRDAACIT
jgi:hypothetical protein